MLRAAVVGVGRIGSLHAAIYDRDPRTQVVGVMDADATTAASVARTLGVPMFVDVATLLRDTRPDIVSIAVPESHRYAPSVAAAEAGAHLLLEKPLSPTVADTQALVAALTGTTTTVMVNYILRSDPRYLQVRRAAAEGTLGEVRTLSAYRRGTSAGAEMLRSWTGLLISTAIHDIDAMTWIAGAPVERVYAEAVAEQPDGQEDAVVATLRFTNGAIGTLDTSWVRPNSSPDPLQAALHVVGTEGAARIEGSNHGLSILTSESYQLPDLANWPTGRDGVGGCLNASVRHFIDCVSAKTRPEMGLSEALAAEAVVAGMRESIRTATPQEMSYAAGTADGMP